ncbi:hypothetical protein KR018_009238 [Drosophila ironensis]|nr:hypothetical protein KR018_009238 [Drosophila ironensis]
MVELSGAIGKALTVLIIAGICIQYSHSLFKFTNVKCSCYDKSFCDFSQCELKVQGRGRIALSIYVKVRQLPVKRVRVNMSLFRKFSGYRPFMYNITVDACNFFRSAKRHPWFTIGYNMISNFTNVNHSCPYNHDIIVSNLVLTDEMLDMTPFPTGSYMLQVIVGNPKWQGMVQAMTDIVEIDRTKKMFG